MKHFDPEYQYINDSPVDLSGIEGADKPRSVSRVTPTQANAIAAATSDAYSHSRYGGAAWTACARMLARREFDADQIEAIMRSKWMRWAADSSKNVQPTSKDLERFLDDPRNQASTANVNRLVNGTL
jgi:hypothetical protein